MNFVLFPVASTNLFPAANSKNGGQLATEWNLKSRETVATSPTIKYEVGPSYVHSMDDFEVRILSDDSGIAINNYTIEIMPGRGVLNGHFIESLVPVSVDLLEANVKLKQQAQGALKGKLAIGLRAFYATEQTIAGSILVENEHDMYQGVQVVILPEQEFITPIESPTDKSKVTADLRLATFSFTNNKISNIKMSEDKLRCMSAERIANIDQMLSDAYVKKTGLNAKKLYSFAGKGTDPATGLDTWQDVTDSTLVWDEAPQRTLEKPKYKSSRFIADEEGAYLYGAHKQVEGMTTDDGIPEYYEAKLIQIPNADYGKGTAGVVNKSYTSNIKEIARKVNEFRSTLTGKQIRYIPIKDSDTVLGPINSEWSNGDYILVGQDYTAADINEATRFPSTMYVVLPGIVSAISFLTQTDVDVEKIPSQLHGAQLGYIEGATPPDTASPESYPSFFSNDDALRGEPNSDYFRYRYSYSERTESGVFVNHFIDYYYVVSAAGKRDWSDYVIVTGQVGLATEDTIGGFLNVSTDNKDYGYVYLDEYGRLKLVDYELLRSGTLAYQLGDDVSLPSGLTAEETQTYLDEYVNQRIAFPSASKMLTSDTPNTVDVTLFIYAEDAGAVINIADIDSRFNTSVTLHISGDGTATSDTVINIYDCEKIRIDSNISGNPTINVYRSNLYYDPYIFNYIRGCDRGETTFTGMEDIKIWYQIMAEGDPNLVVDNMTVSELDAPIIAEELDYWKESGAYANDNYYRTALKSITFAGNGDIVGCGLLVGNNSTDNVDPGTKIVVAEFTLPQGAGLAYPKACMTRALKITGTFVSAYYGNTDKVWYVTDNNFTAMTQTYDPYDLTVEIKGNIAFHSTTSLIESSISQTSIPVWETDSYHLFYGGSSN